MIKIVLSSIIVLMSSTLFSQHSLKKLWESDSVTLNGPESVLFDSKSNSLYVSSMNAGTVVRLSSDGKVISKDWVTGLKSNKGSALFNGFLYTAEQSGVALIDVAKASVIKRIPVEGAVMLNDLAIDDKGVIYVSDTRAGKVYQIEGDKPRVYLENIPGANGLLTINTDLYVLSSTSVAKINAAKQMTKIVDSLESGLDGIVMVAQDEFVISDYHGVLYCLKPLKTGQKFDIG